VNAGCLFCGRPVEEDAPCCPALALAGVLAHAGCCGGCATTSPAAVTTRACAHPSTGAAK
jgi:hypothetical protein